FVDQRRCCHGGRGEFCRQATTRSCDCWTSIGTPTPTSRASLKAARSSRQLRRPAAWSRSRLARLPAPTSLSCVPISPRPLALPDGPRVGALALNGWDTHYNEGIATGWLAQLLGALDGALAAVQENMGPAWRETVVVLVTEFGRTARINGTNGTDHGTATVM